MRTFLSEWFAALYSGVESDVTSQILERVVPLFPALATLSWLVVMIIDAALAQGLLVKWGKALRASPDYASIEAPEWAYWALVAAAALKLASSGDVEYLAQNLVVVLSAPFFFVGLAVAHTLVQRTRLPAASLIVFYFLLLISTWFAVLVAAIGFVEQWARLRVRYGSTSRDLTPRHQSEDE